MWVDPPSFLTFSTIFSSLDQNGFSSLQHLAVLCEHGRELKVALWSNQPSLLQFSELLVTNQINMPSKSYDPHYVKRQIRYNMLMLEIMD